MADIIQTAEGPVKEPAPRDGGSGLKGTLASAIRLRPFKWFTSYLHDILPKGLYTRSLLIIVIPMVILQSVVAYVFMERHWELVTRRLSGALASDISALIDFYESAQTEEGYETLRRVAFEKLDLTVAILPQESLPPAGPRPFFSLLDRTLSRELTSKVRRPFWIDTVGRSNIVEIRILLDDVVFRVFAKRKRAYASNSHIFLVWMIGTSAVLLLVAILFLRNQIVPIQRLADAAESFGKGQPVPETFKPRGAREVRRAAHAFIEMRRRIERQIEQRTAMLSGVSHDLRTVLTRFKLQLALLPDSEEVQALRADVDEMQQMLQEYMDFARGDAGEVTAPTEIGAVLSSLKEEAQRVGRDITLHCEGSPIVNLKPQAFKRCISNLVQNALRFGSTVEVRAYRQDNWLIVRVEDNGPGLPEEEREAVFRPFYRLDDARNQDHGGTGLGLAIARDVARSHGGDLRLDDSSLGGLAAILRIPA